MDSSRPVLGVLAVASFVTVSAIGAVYVWPTRFRYHETRSVAMREDRFTGATEMLLPGGGWEPAWSPAAASLVRTHGAPAESSGVVAVVEVANTPEQRGTGLKNRTDLGDDAGMLFAWPAADRRHMWMKDCGLHLDFAFMRSDGTVAGIETLTSGVGVQDDAQMPRSSCDVPVPYVLAMNAGWFARHGITAGERIDTRSAMEGIAPK